MLSVTTAAADLQLLSDEQQRAAAGLATDDESQDAALALVGARAAADITTACKVRIGSGGEPTLRRETLTETFRGARRKAELVLARRHDVTVTSVTVDDVVLAADEYEVDPESGLLYRLSSDCRITWSFAVAVVVYAAGFATVPADLAGAASDLVRIRTSEAARDPLVKGESIEVPDVETRRIDYWVGALPGSGGGQVPTDILNKLSRYMNIVIG